MRYLESLKNFNKIHFEHVKYIKEDLSFGDDIRGDEALFIEDKHFDGDDVDNEVKSFILEMINDGEIRLDEKIIFFRVIEDGIETDSHGWLSVSRRKDKISVYNWG
jgi:hypothetical protein